MAMLKKGDTAPDFSLVAEDGSAVSLADLLVDGPVVLYFYPADFTPICTAEACSIRDMHDDIAGAGVRVVGISPQSAASHDRFKRKYELPFRLLYDEGRRVIRAFGVDGPFGIGVRRATFLVGTDHRILGRVVSDLFVGSHIRFIREQLDAMQG